MSVCSENLFALEVDKIRQILFSFSSGADGHAVMFLCVNSPDVPPALQVLLDDLHGDPFLKANFIFPLTGVRLYCHIFLLCRLKEKRK